MNFTANFVETKTSNVLPVDLVAVTQVEFNEQLRAASQDVLELGWAGFTITTETLDGDAQQLREWTDEYEPEAGSFQVISEEEDPGRNDHLQFARVVNALAELGAVTPELVAALSRQLACEPAFVRDVVERATCAITEYIDRAEEVETSENKV